MSIDGFEQTYSEGKGTGYSKVPKGDNGVEASLREIRVQERQAENLKRYGDWRHSGNIIEDGTQDRIKGTPFDNNKCIGDPNGYTYGYFVRGSRVVDGMLEGKTKEEIYQRGRLDASIGIPKDKLGLLVQRESYMVGYEEYLQEITNTNSGKKHR